MDDTLYNASISILQHCDSTNHEVLYLINSFDGSAFAKVTNTAINSGIAHSEDFAEKLKEAREKELAKGMGENSSFFYHQGTDIDRASEIVYEAYGLTYIIVN